MDYWINYGHLSSYPAFNFLRCVQAINVYLNHFPTMGLAPQQSGQNGSKAVWKLCLTKLYFDWGPFSVMPSDSKHLKERSVMEITQWVMIEFNGLTKSGYRAGGARIHPNGVDYCIVRFCGS